MKKIYTFAIFIISLILGKLCFQNNEFLKQAKYSMQTLNSSLFSCAFSQITVTTTTNLFLSSSEIQGFFVKLKQDPRNVTKQDQNAMILLDFIRSFDEFRISLSLHLHFHSYHQKHCFALFMCLLICKEIHLIDRIKRKVIVATPAFGSSFGDFNFKMKIYITFFNLISYLCLRKIFSSLHYAWMCPKMLLEAKTTNIWTKL